MKLKLCALFILIACFLSMNSSAQKKAAAPVKASVTIKEPDNGKTIAVKKGRSFDVLFKKECVGCRYIWTITQIDSAAIKSISDSYSNKSCTNCTGGNQDHTFHFKALKAGSSSLAFTLGDKAFMVTVKVK